MSRATSGRAISAVNSERWCSSSDISASTISAGRGFLIILTRGDPPAGAGRVGLLFLWRDPPADAGGTDLLLRDPPADAGGTDFALTLLDVASVVSPESS